MVLNLKNDLINLTGDLAYMKKIKLKMKVWKQEKESRKIEVKKLLQQERQNKQNQNL